MTSTTFFIFQEDKPIGHPIVKFLITDLDAPPNGSPFTFDFLSGNDESSFLLDQDGTIRTATKFIKRIKEEYILYIRVFDNGSKPLYTDTKVTVKIFEESQYPPILNQMEVFVNSYLEEFPGGIIGKVMANDKDIYDTLTYTFFPTLGIPYPITELFSINQTDGTLKALQGIDFGEYQLNISVTDGKFFTNSVVPVTFEIISEEMIQNSVLIRFRSVTEKTFLLYHRKEFLRSIRNSINTRLKDIVIISLQSDEENNVYKSDLDVLFCVRKTKGNFYTSDEIRKVLNDNLEELEESTKLVVEEIVGTKCSLTYCTSGVCRDRIVLQNTDSMPTLTESVSFLAPKFERKLDCICKEGFEGDKCETVVNNCAHEPCPMFKICVPDSSSQGKSFIYFYSEKNLVVTLWWYFKLWIQSRY